MTKKEKEHITELIDNVVDHEGDIDQIVYLYEEIKRMVNYKYKDQ